MSWGTAPTSQRTALRETSIKRELGSATTLIETSLNQDHEAAGIVCPVTPWQSTIGSFSPQVSVCTL